MILRRHFKGLAIAAAVVGTSATQVDTAEACGGLFCNAALPVNQAAERIIFSDNGDGTVTAVIEIQYQGPSESFAWVLPVPEGELDIGVSSKLALDRLDQQSNPTYQLNRVFPDECQAVASPSAGGGGLGGDTASESDDGGSVVVLESGAVGPYIYDVIGVDEDSDDAAAELVAWLQEREYDVDDSMTDLLAPYIDSGLNMVAFKLDKDSDAGSIRPVKITYESEVPFIPLRPTAMAALEDMGVKVWVLGSSRAIPTTYLHLEINQALINWFDPNSNYNDVIIAAANEAGGMGFITEQAGPAGEFSDAIYTADPDLGGGDAWRRDQLATTDFGVGAQSYEAFFETAVSYFANYDGFREVIGDPAVVPLREGARVDQFIACVSCYFSEQSGAGTTYPPTPFDPESDPILDFDAFAFLDALDTEVLNPLAETRELFDDATTVSRMYTTISPDEMLEDPAFDFNPELGDVDNRHIAEQLLTCDTADWTISLPQGMKIKGTGVTWPLEIGGDMPANLRIIQMSTVGGGTSVEDNAAEVAELLTSLGVGEAGPELMDPPGPDPVEMQPEDMVDPMDPEEDPTMEDPSEEDPLEEDPVTDDPSTGPSNQQDDEEGDDPMEEPSDEEVEEPGDEDEVDDALDEEDGAEPVEDGDEPQEVASEDEMADASADDGGCGCRTVGHAAPLGGSWAALGLIGLALLRRRRRG